MDVFLNLQLPEHGRLSRPFPEKFHKISTENDCDWRKIRSELVSTGVTSEKHYTKTQDISRWNKVTSK